jgi:hypothetical protein
MISKTHSPLVKVPETAFSWAIVPGWRNLVNPVARKNRGSLVREYCSLAGRLNSKSASRRVLDGWWIATSSWFVCWVIEWREIYRSASPKCRRRIRTSGSNPYLSSSPPEPNSPAQDIPGFCSLCLLTPIALIHQRAFSEVRDNEGFTWHWGKPSASPRCTSHAPRPELQST